MATAVDPGEAWGAQIIARASAEDRAAIEAAGGTITDIDLRIMNTETGAIYTVAFALNFAEQLEIGAGARVLLHFMGVIPVHSITIEGAPDGKG